MVTSEKSLAPAPAAATAAPAAQAPRRRRLSASAPTLTFIGRRLLSSAVVLLGATFIVYMLVAYALDPLEDLYTSTAPNKEQLIEARTRALDLDTPPVIRYFKWLAGVLGYLIGRGTLGQSWVTSQEVTDLLASAIPSTVQLVGASTVLAVALGITVGIASALRQYTGFDYSVTFMSFVLYSLPSFWVAVLLKLWGAIGFNDFLADPSLSTPAIVLIAVVSGLVWQVLVGGPLRRRLTTFGLSTLASGLVLFAVLESGWLLDPSLGMAGIAVLGAAAAVGLTAMTTGLHNRRALLSSLTVVAIGVALWFPLQYLFVADGFGGLWVLGLAVLSVVVGLVVGRLYGGPDYGQSMRNAAITAFVVAGLIYVDRVMQVWQPYSDSSYINGRPIATIGSQTPGLNGDYWVETLDRFTHLILPTIALILISFASYTRYSRASLLEVMNQDYIRTARAKGLPERVVTVRHAFRNALIPLATIIPLDIAALFGGAIITERIFSWSGMGSLFIHSLGTSDINPIMGYFLVVGTLLVLANIVVDFVYAALDPRIRVNA